ALTGNAAQSARNTGRNIGEEVASLEKLSNELKNPASELSVDSLRDQIRTRLGELQRTLATALIPLRTKRRFQFSATKIFDSIKRTFRAVDRGTFKIFDVADELLAKATTVENAKLVVDAVANASDDQLRSLIDSIKKRSPSFAALLGATDGTKVSFVAAVS